MGYGVPGAPFQIVPGIVGAEVKLGHDPARLQFVVGMIALETGKRRWLAMNIAALWMHLGVLGELWLPVQRVVEEEPKVGTGPVGAQLVAGRLNAKGVYLR